MTVVSTSTYTDWYDADGVNKNWPYDFSIFSKDDVVIEYTTDVTNPLAYATITDNRIITPANKDYSSGFVTYPVVGTALSEGTFVRVVRTVKYTQATGIGNEGDFSPKIHERAFDLLTMQTQQLARELDEVHDLLEETIALAGSETVIGAPTLLRFRDVEYDFERDFGGTRTGNNSDRLQDVFAHLTERSGFKLKISKPGVYLFSDPKVVATLAGSLTIEWAPGAVWKCDTDFDFPLIFARGTASVDGANEINFINPQIDMSLGDPSIQPSAINITNFLRSEGTGGFLYGGATRALAKGDSGVETVNVKHFNWRGGVVHGFKDAGFYLGGANAAGPSDDGGLHSIIGVTIRQSGTAAVFKRDGYLMNVMGCLITDCDGGIATAEVGPGQDQNTGQYLQVLGNHMRKIRSAGLIFRGKTKGEAIGNHITDVGYEADGVTPVAARYFIGIQGASEINLSSNVCKMKDWTPTDQVGITISGITDQAGVVWVGGDCSGSGNRFDNIPVTFQEGGGTTTVASKFTSQHVSGSEFASPAMRSGSIFEHTTEARTGKFTAAYLGTNPTGAPTIFKDNIPKGTFRAYLSGDVVLTTPTSPTVIPFDAEMEDYGGFFNVANGRWTPEVGLYLVNVRLRVLLANNPEAWTVQLRRNGGVPVDSASWYDITYSTSGDKTLGGMVMLPQVNANDYWEVWLSASGAGNKTIKSALSHTSWSAHRIA